MKPEEFKILLQQAREGNERPLNQYLRNFLEERKQSLIRWTKSVQDAEECIQGAIEVFFEQYVKGGKELPTKNISNYIHGIAINLYRDNLRDKKREAEAIKNMNVESDEEANAEEMYELRLRAIEIAVSQMSHRCQAIVNTILDFGIDPRNITGLNEHLEWENERRVSTRKSDCFVRLRILAAIELERLLRNL